MFSYASADLAPLLVAATLIGSGTALTMLSIQQVIGERADPARRPAAFAWFAMGASVSGVITSAIITGIYISVLQQTPY